MNKGGSYFCSNLDSFVLSKLILRQDWLTKRDFDKQEHGRCDIAEEGALIAPGDR